MAYKSQLKQFQDILEHQDIRMVYQPIVSLIDGNVYGYEALTRGPSDGPFHSPEALFKFAEGQGYLYQLEKLTREKAIQNAVLTTKEQMLFINISSPVICDPEFIPGKTLEVLQQMGLNPNNVVFEITERSSIEDFSLAKKVLEHYRSQGYKLAIDDAGAGYSSLQAIAELHPDFIKVDRSLVQNIHKEKIKEYILETFVTFAQKMNIQIIAEGIEHNDELVKLTKMGVHYAQGFLLGRPEQHSVQIDPDLMDKIHKQYTANIANGSSWTIGDLAVPITTFEQTTIISEVSNYFFRNESSTGSVVILDQKPVGLMMRERLFQQLSMQYGHSLFWKRPIVSMMDNNPLIVDENLTVDQVSQMAMSRDKSKIYDLVIITSKAKMFGVASIQSILACITNIRLESARVASPLTGLPGNIQIHREMQKRAGDNRRFSVIYADLDFFKWFNDRYGFQKGDHLLQFTADVIQHAVAGVGHQQDFIGHIGGDDFVIISYAEEPERLCEEIIRSFDQGVKTFYGGDKWEFVEDRKGNLVINDGVTISLSLVVCDNNSVFTSLEQISLVAAGLKKLAKSQRGSVYLSEELGVGRHSG